MDKFKSFFIYFLIFVSTCSVVFIFYQLNKHTKNSNPNPNPVPFELLKEIPQNNTNSPILTTQSIEFQFSKPIDITSVSLEVNPFQKYLLSTIDNDKTLLIQPQPVWEENINYNLKMRIKAKDGEEIPQIDYNFKIVPITDSNLTE